MNRSKKSKTTRFNVKKQVIVVRVRLSGLDGLERWARMALDTGASITSIRTDFLTALGYDLSMVLSRTRIITGTQAETVPILSVAKVTALKQERDNMVVVAHTLPPNLGIDGLLGLDFFASQTLTIDFAGGTITLE